MSPSSMGLRSRLSAVAAVSVTGLVLMSQPALAQLAPPTVPPSLQVPAGNTLYLVGHARGYQIYRCQAQGSTFAWTLLAPFAGLFDDRGRAVALHYAGPSWQAPDHSIVVGTRVASANAPTAGAIPWLLLRAVSNTPAPGGDGAFAETTYIQRLNTTGGVAPSTGCDAAHVGATVAVPYTADYYFYRAT